MVLGKKAKHQYVIEVKGLMCGHCEAAISESLRQSLAVVQVRANHIEGKVILQANQQLTLEDVKGAVELSGYQFIAMQEVV